MENTTLTKTDGAKYYTNFIVKDDGTLTIGNLDAGNANLKLEAEKVVVNGKVKAKTVKIKASDTSDILIDKELPIEIAGVKKIEAGSAFNFNTATVDVKKSPLHPKFRLQVLSRQHSEISRRLQRQP